MANEPVISYRKHEELPPNWGPYVGNLQKLVAIRFRFTALRVPQSDHGDVLAIAIPR